MGFSPKFEITNAIAAGLTKVERARGFLEAAKLSEDWIAEMQNRALVLEAHHTTHIEGTHLTLEQSEKLLSDKKVAGADPDDTRELLNYRSAFDLVDGVSRQRRGNHRGPGPRDPQAPRERGARRQGLAGPVSEWPELRRQLEIRRSHLHASSCCGSSWSHG